MSLNQILKDVEAEILGRRGDEIKPLFDSQVAAAEAHLASARVIGVGDTAPDFSLTATNGEYISLRDALSRGQVILTFYRGSGCNFCNAALITWQRALPELEAKGVTLLAIAPETPDICRDYKQAAGLDYELLSDLDNETADAYGLAFELPELAREMLSDLNTNVGDRNGNGSWTVPITATYAIGSDQRILLADCGPDYRRRVDPQDAIAIL